MSTRRPAGPRFDPYEMMADLQRRHTQAAAVLADEFPTWTTWTLADLERALDHVASHPHLRSTPAPPILRAHLTRAAR